jgi:hypothetical protein
MDINNNNKKNNNNYVDDEDYIRGRKDVFHLFFFDLV